MREKLRSDHWSATASKNHAAAVTDQKRVVKSVAETRQGGACGRLAAMHPLRRVGDALGVEKGVEGDEEVQVEVGEFHARWPIHSMDSMYLNYRFDEDRPGTVDSTSHRPDEEGARPPRGPISPPDSRPRSKTTMQYKLFGKTGLRVSELCLGTMTFGESWGWGASSDESKRLFEVFIDAGGNFIDTANAYTGGDSERFLGELLTGRRHDYVLATKYSLSTNPKDPNAGGNQRKNMMRAIDESLDRLRTDFVDIYWVHAWDFYTPAEEVMRGLEDLVRSGKVHYIGLSDAPAWYLAKANTLAELRGWSVFAGIQMQYSLIERTIEREILPYAKTHGLLTCAWSPLGGGMLTGKYGAGKNRHEPDEGRHRTEDGLRDYFLTDRNFAIAETVKPLRRSTAFRWRRWRWPGHDSVSHRSYRSLELASCLSSRITSPLSKSR